MGLSHSVACCGLACKGLTEDCQVCGLLWPSLQEPEADVLGGSKAPSCS